MSRRRCMLLPLLATPFLLLAGCFQMEQRLSLEANGKLSFALNYSIPEKYLPAFNQLQAQISTWQDSEVKSTGSWMFDRDKVTDFFPEQTFTITSYKVYQRGGHQHAEIAGKASDAGAALRSGKLGDFTLIEQRGKLIGLELKLPTAPVGAVRTDAEKRALREAGQGLAVKLVIETPRPVKETNGEKTGVREVTWSFNTELLADPAGIPDTLTVRF